AVAAGHVAGGFDRLADVAGDDPGAERGGDIGEPAGAAAGIQDQLAFQPFRRPPRIGQESPFGKPVTGQRVDLDILPALPLESEVSKVSGIGVDESGHTAPDRERGGAIAAREGTLLDVVAGTALDGEFERAGRTAGRTFQN